MSNFQDMFQSFLTDRDDPASDIQSTSSNSENVQSETSTRPPSAASLSIAETPLCKDPSQDGTPKTVATKSTPSFQHLDESAQSAPVPSMTVQQVPPDKNAETTQADPIPPVPIYEDSAPMSVESSVSMTQQMDASSIDDIDSQEEGEGKKSKLTVTPPPPWEDTNQSMPFDRYAAEGKDTITEGLTSEALSKDIARVQDLEEDSMCSVKSGTKSPRTPGKKRLHNNTVVNELGHEGHKEFTADQVFEYQWPQGERSAEWHVLQEQISEFLGVLSFKRKYPDLTRRPVEFNERIFLQEQGVVTETQCDLGLTVLKSEEVYDLASRDYPEKYKEIVKVLRKREQQRIAERKKANEVPPGEKYKIALQNAIKRAAEFNSHFMREKREERRSYFDLQTMEIHFQKGRKPVLPKEATKVGLYPVAVLPGQYSDYYKGYSSQELKYFPVNTALYSPPKHVKSIFVNPEKSVAGESDSENSDDGTSSSGASGTTDSEIDSDIEKAFDDTEAQEGDEGKGEEADAEAAEEAEEEKEEENGDDEDDRPLAEVAETASVTSEVQSESNSTPAKPRRGRPPGSKNKKKKEEKDKDKKEEKEKGRVSLTLARKKGRDVPKCTVCSGTANKNKLGQEEDLVTCSQCNTHAHPGSCLELTDEMIPIIRTYPWECMECKTCVKCKDPYDEDKMMFCDHCDRGYHTFCVGLKAIPTGRWECSSCQATEEPPKKKQKKS